MGGGGWGRQKGQILHMGGRKMRTGQRDVETERNDREKERERERERRRERERDGERERGRGRERDSRTDSERFSLGGRGVLGEETVK